MSDSDVRINGGFFVCRRELLDWIEPGDELVEETFSRLIPRGEVVAFPYEGFFGPMDTIKDRQRLEALHESRPRSLAQGRVARGTRAEAGLMLAVRPWRRRGAAPTPAGHRLPCGRRRDRLRRDDPLAGRVRDRSRGHVGRAWRARRSGGRGAGERRGLPGGRGPRRGRRPRVPRRVHALRRRGRQGGFRGSEARPARPRASRTRATTGTRTIASPASSRGTRSAIT